MRPEVADDILIWVYVTEDALKLAKERDARAATELEQDALKLANVERAAKTATAEARRAAVEQKNAVLLASFGY